MIGRTESLHGRPDYTEADWQIQCSPLTELASRSERPHTAEAEWLFSLLRRPALQQGRFKEVFRREGIQGMPSRLGRV